MPTLHYRIDARTPWSRELGVELAWSPDADTAAAELFLPSWTPGSYLIREYARHLSRVEAFDADDGRRLACRKTSKNRFEVERAGARRIAVRYRVYAHELSVRTADLDASHAYWNHACVLLWPVDRPEADAEIEVLAPPGWTVACALPSRGSDDATTLVAEDLDHALDAPVLVGRPQRIEWQVDGVPHAIVLDGLDGIEPPASLASDLERIVRRAAAVFGGTPCYDRYLFLALFADEGHGGLEHRDSSTLLMARTALADERGYREFLGLAAHELFHAWNVKRMRPQELWRYDYERENYTGFLWLVEGWTAYYDDLLVARAGLMSAKDYLAAMTKNVQNLFASPGRLRLTLEESSFDAWIRLYRPDENTRNSSQNYYGNGAVAAMCLDLFVRRTTAHARSLDDVLRELWTTFEEGRGYTMADVERALRAVAGDEAVRLLHDLVRGPLDPTLDEALADVGVAVQRAERDRPFLGVTFRAGTTVVAAVVAESAACAAGLAPGDEVLAVRGLRVTPETWQKVFAAVARPGTPVDVLVARRGVLRTLTAAPDEGPAKVQLVPAEHATEAQLAARRAWLHDAH